MKISLTERVVNAVLRGIIRCVCVIDTRDLEKIPLTGPGILASNHTSIIEGPLYYAFLKVRGRRMTALGKLELWKNPVTRFLMQTWRIIPINRSGPDRTALRRAMNSLDNGAFLGIAPEGTRSRSGELQKGRPGAAMLAIEANVPIFPVVQWGARDLTHNLRRLRRTPVQIAVGEPFYVRLPEARRPKTSELRRITDELMYQLAVILPEQYRGHYRDLSLMTTEFIHRP